MSEQSRIKCTPPKNNQKLNDGSNKKTNRKNDKVGYKKIRKPVEKTTIKKPKKNSQSRKFVKF